MTVETPLFDYPFVKGEKGFSFEELLKRRELGENVGSIISESGAKLDYDISKNSITIMDLSNEEFLLSSYNIHGVTTFSLRTRYRKDKSTHHPDLFAKKFLKCALDYFRMNGLETRACEGEWHVGSDNYEAYIQNILAHHDKFEAAKATWTGKAFAELGYNKVDSVDQIFSGNYHSYYVLARFFKE